MGKGAASQPSGALPRLVLEPLWRQRSCGGHHQSSPPRWDQERASQPVLLPPLGLPTTHLLHTTTKVMAKHRRSNPTRPSRPSSLGRFPS